MVFGVELMGQSLIFNDGQDCFCVAGRASALDCGQGPACDVDSAGVASGQPGQRFVQFAGICFVHGFGPLVGCRGLFAPVTLL
jgi:hypothetical protein